MPKFTIYRYDKSIKRGVRYNYNTDASRFICNIPNGKLYLKPQKWAFFAYYPYAKEKKEMAREVSYYEARDLIRTYGTREQYCEFFTVLNADGSYKPYKRTKIWIDEVHRVKLFRTAAHFNLTPAETVHYLIDLYDDHKNFNRPAPGNKIKKQVSQNPDISDFTS